MRTHTASKHPHQIGWIVLILACTACGTQEALSLSALQLPASELPGVERMEIKSQLSRQDQARGSLALQALRDQKLEESGYFKYHLGAGQRGGYKIKINIFSDAGSRRQAWQRKFPPQVLATTESRDWGDEGFEVPGKFGAFGLGRLSLEAEASGQANQLSRVLERYARRAAQLSD